MNDAFPLIKPKEFIAADEEGKERKFLISKFDAVAGREIVAKYPLSSLPVIGDYQVSEDTMLKLMGYVAVELEGGKIQRLGSRALINNHVGDWETLGKIEVEMMKYNCSFFRDGKVSTFLDELVRKVMVKLSETLTRSSEQSSPAAKPPSTNSEPSIP